MSDSILDRLNLADQALTNVEDCVPPPPDTAAFQSAIDAARAAIDSARAQAIEAGVPQ